MPPTGSSAAVSTEPGHVVWSVGNRELRQPRTEADGKLVTESNLSLCATVAGLPYVANLQNSTKRTEECGQLLRAAQAYLVRCRTFGGFVMRILAVTVAVAMTAAALAACSASPPRYRTVTVGTGLSVTVPAAAPKVTAAVSPARLRNDRLLRQLAPAEHLTTSGTLPPGGALLT